MKARQIIPGWPRGRSVGWNKYNLADDSNQPCLMFKAYQSWEMLSHAEFERSYHIGQQEMVNAYFEQWRLQYPNPPRNEFYEHITQMAEAFLVG